jgi:hypothetical protein
MKMVTQTMNTGGIHNLATSLLCILQYFIVQVTKWQRWHPWADGIRGKKVHGQFLWQPWHVGLAATSAMDLLS